MTETQPIRVLIADDHTLFRQGLQKVLEEYREVDVVGEARDGREATVKVEETSPDIVLMDIKMPRRDGVEATQLIKAEHPSVRVVILSMHEDAEYVLKAVRAGASGFVQKTISADRLVDTIKQVHDGDSPPVHLTVDAKTLQKVVPIVPDTRQDMGLTEQEMCVLKCMADGKPNKQIATSLSISGQTVKWHVSSILRKMEASDRTQAVAEAFRSNLVN
ncbi:MAG: response regulator transcription factor [Chloroflexi bacterium]|nr:response regulator transcription factor [Chloroflexota bacterium]